MGKGKEEVSNVVLTEEQVMAHEAAIKHISTGFKKIEGGYLSIAKDVAVIKQNESYTYNGYNSISAAMRGMFGMSKQTTSNLLAIAYRFGDPITFDILPEYKKATMKALLAVAPLTKEEEAQLPMGWQFWTESDLKKKVKEIKGLPDKGGKAAEKEKKAEKESDSANGDMEESTGGLTVYAEISLDEKVWDDDTYLASLFRSVMRKFDEEGNLDGSFELKIRKKD